MKLIPLAFTFIQLALVTTAGAQQVVRVETPTVLQFKLHVLSSELLPGATTVTFKFYDAKQGGTALFARTMKDLDLSDGIGPDVTFASNDHDDTGKPLEAIFKQSNLFYTTQIKDRNETRREQIVLSAPAANVPTEPTPTRTGSAQAGPGSAERFQKLEREILTTDKTTALVVDLRGGSPAVRLSTLDGLQRRKDKFVTGGEVRLIPESLVRIKVLPHNGEPPDSLVITKNHVSADSGQTSVGGVTSTAIAPVWFGYDADGHLRIAYDSATKAMQLWTADAQEVGSARPMVADDYKEIVVWLTAGKSIEQSISIPTDGNISVELRDGGAQKYQVRLLPAAEWNFQDAFEPYMSLTTGSHAQFASMTKFKTFGFNKNLRIDTVAVFAPGAKTADDTGFLGAGITWSPVWGSLYKTDGHHFFGFPLRFNITLGLKGLSFESHVKGSGAPFLGFGIQIPFGG